MGLAVTPRRARAREKRVFFIFELEVLRRVEAGGNSGQEARILIFSTCLSLALIRRWRATNTTIDQEDGIGNWPQ